MAKKRYHQSKMDRRHEREGEMRREKHLRHEGAHMMRDREMYAGEDGTRRMTSRDSGMIKDDWNAPALLPQHVIERYWPTAYNRNMGYVDSLFNGVQKQLHEDYDDLHQIMEPKKY